MYPGSPHTRRVVWVLGIWGVGERKVRNAGLNGGKNSPCHEEYRFDILLSVPDILTVV